MFQLDRAGQDRRRVIRKRLRLLATVSLLSTVCPIVFSLVASRTAFVVISDSMSPLIVAGDLVLTRPVTRELSVGALVVFKSPLGGFEVHRVVDIISSQRTFYLTKGDANEEADSFLIPQDSVIGEVSYVLPKLGFLLLMPRETALTLTLMLSVTYIVLTFRSTKGIATIEPSAEGGPNNGKDGLK